MATKTKKPRPRAKERACDNAIRKTLAYSGVFKYPMSKYQLYTFLITKKDFEVDFFEKSLRRLVKKNHIKARDSKYYLPGVRPVSWSLRNKYTRELFKETEFCINTLKKIPWIKMLAVTGSVASNNANKDDDIDIFIISQRNRVWLTRFFTFLILKVLGKYAQGKNNERKLCCNLFVDETKIKWPENKRNFYIAYEIASMHPLIDRDNTYFKFLKTNDWIFTHFRNYKVNLPKKFKKSIKGSGLIEGFEIAARKLQLWYMRKKKTSEITKKDFIHFNKHDHTEKILSDFKEYVEKI